MFEIKREDYQNFSVLYGVWYTCA